VSHKKSRVKEGWDEAEVELTVIGGELEGAGTGLCECEHQFSASTLGILHFLFFYFAFISKFLIYISQ
jgi:hypothetical protein